MTDSPAELPAAWRAFYFQLWAAACTIQMHGGMFKATKADAAWDVQLNSRYK